MDSTRSDRLCRDRASVQALSLLQSGKQIGTRHVDNGIAEITTWGALIPGLSERVTSKIAGWPLEKKEWL